MSTALDSILLGAYAEQPGQRRGDGTNTAAPKAALRQQGGHKEKR